MKCNRDCFNCPFPDCINDYVKVNDPEYQKRYYEEHRSQELERKKKTREDRKANGLCTYCGKRPLTEGSKAHCIECLIKLRKRSMERNRKKGLTPKKLFDGIDLCKKCGKEKPVEGYKLCESCLEKARQAIELGRSRRKRDPFRETNEYYAKK